MTTELRQTASLTELLGTQPLPFTLIDYENTPLHISPSIKTTASLRVLIASYASFLHRQSNEATIEFSIHLEDRVNLFNYTFTPDSIVGDVLRQADLAMTTVLPANYPALALTFATGPISNEFALALIVENDALYFQSTPAIINTKNETLFNTHFETLLNSFDQLSELPIMAIPIVTDAELETYALLNNTSSLFNNRQCMHTIFSNTAKKHPHKAAFLSVDHTITFSELDEQSNSIANSLIHKNIMVGDYVAVYMERSIDAIIAMLGVMKAGAVYVPISPDNPQERNEFIMNDTQTSIILTDDKTNSLAKIIAPPLAKVLLLEQIKNDSFTRPIVDVTALDIAYIIYTSGSTGRPKGVKIPHKSIATFGYAETQIFNFSAEDVLTQFYTLTFDASMLELCPMIFSGATLYMLSKEERLDISLFAAAIDKHNIVGVPMVPVSAMKQYSLFATAEDKKKMAQLRYFGVGGEALPAEVARLFQKSFGLIPLINVYGPTECSVLTTTYRIDKIVENHITNIPIGTPLSNYRVHILNEAQQYCPVGVAGEMYIESEGLAEGYLNLPLKTDEVFVHTAYSSNKMYRSGDIVRLSNDGLLEFAGRKDSQVKIRGFRVELGEIEDHLLKANHIVDGAIVTTELQGELTLIAYYQKEKNCQLNAHSLTADLKQQLPSYMIPSYFIEVENFPLLPSGKINRAELSNRPIKSEKSSKVISVSNATTPTEKNISQAWCDVLNITSVGIKEDFFEIGGHSLKVLALLSKLKKTYPIFKINDFFQYRTIEELANYADHANLNTMVEKIMTVHTDLVEHPISLGATATAAHYEQQHILLTGATGYLGAHLLLQLLKSTSCTPYIIVRAKNKAAGLARIIDTLRQYDHDFVEKNSALINNCSIIIGDFTQKNIGMSSTDLQFVRTTIQAIIHCGADVRHFGNKEQFKKNNIESTSYLAEFAKTCTNARFHYVSTLGIQEDLAVEGKWDPFLQQEKITDAPLIDSLYTNSKLESEKLLQRYFDDGLPVTIYRPGNITCQASTGIFQKNIDTNAVYRMFKSFILLGKAPDVSFAMDFTMVDYASELITKLALNDSTVGGIYNICNTTQIDFKDVIQHFIQYGYTIELVDESEFIRFVGDDTPKNIEGVELAMAGIEGDGAKNSPLVYRCPQSTKFMQAEHLVCPPPSEAFFTKMIDYAVSINYFPKPITCI
ncbi:non-ribosomal peptide synthetase [Kurthia sibirica]|nr:non-ribosomal peptide synthetase [Kurthia sibirica]GEK34126.1 peptide synthetase [Kurthia sibirica]